MSDDALDPEWLAERLRCAEDFLANLDLTLDEHYFAERVGGEIAVKIAKDFAMATAEGLQLRRQRALGAAVGYVLAFICDERQGDHPKK